MAVHMAGSPGRGRSYQIVRRDKPFKNKLDSLFLATGDLGSEAPEDISGLIGEYAHGNEPSHHIAYMYAYAGLQWKTAEKVSYILRNLYQ